MPRYKISVEYDGGPFVGWQRQDTGPSIQAALEDAIAAFTGERAHVQGAGRTDAGVHARGQVAHFDLAAEKPTDEVRGALNFHLKPHPIVVPTVELAVPGFHARFSATWRRYRYRILNRRAPAALWPALRLLSLGLLSLGLLGLGLLGLGRCRLLRFGAFPFAHAAKSSSTDTSTSNHLTSKYLRSG